MSRLRHALLLGQAEFELLRFRYLLQAAKEYEAGWLGNGRSVYREGGRFSKKIASSPDTPNFSNFDDILGKPDRRLNYASGIMSVFNPAVAQRYANAETLSKDLPKASAEEALAKRVAYMDYKEVTNKETTNPAALIVQRDLDRRGLKIDGIIDDAPSGFKALKLNSKANDRPMLVVTGSETNGLEDLEEDLIGEVGDDQYALNAKRIGNYLKEQKDKGYKVEVSGHSLGGALSQMIAAHHPDKISKVTTFNAAGVPNSVGKTYEENVANLEDKPQIDHHVVDSDFVSLAGDRFLDGKVHVSGNYGNPLDAHLAMIGDHPERDVPIEEINSPDYAVQYLGEKLNRTQQAEYRAEIQPLLATIFAK